MSSTSDVPPALREWAAMAGPTRLLVQVRTRAEKGARTEAGVLRTLVLTGAERREVGLLLGTPWEVSGRPVRLQDFAEKLREHGLTVLDLITALDGKPPVDRRARRAAVRDASTRERADAEALLGAAGIAEDTADAWLSDGATPRPGSGDLLPLVHAVTRVWAALPGDGGEPVRLARLAAAVCGDAHALDDGTVLGRAVARLCAVVHGLDRPQRSGPAWRAAWAAAGVRCDEVSSRVLVLNLPLTGDGPAARLCTAAVGEPVWLTLRQLTGRQDVEPRTTVFVCENPTVVEAAADAFGTACPPLVCTDGVPSGAGTMLLSALAAAGADLRIRADWDEAGFRIVDHLLSLAPHARLWRFDAAEYLRFAGGAGAAPTPGAVTDPHAEHAPPDATDALAQLRTVYAHRQLAVHEEHLLPALLTDLRRPPVGPTR